MANKKAVKKSTGDSSSKAEQKAPLKSVDERTRNNSRSEKENRKIDNENQKTDQVQVGKKSKKRGKGKDSESEKNLEKNGPQIEVKDDKDGKSSSETLENVKTKTVRKTVETGTRADKRAQNSLQNSCDHFTIDFLKKNMSNKGKINVLFSPFGVLTNISMVLNSAFAETKGEMLKVLRLDNFNGDSEIFKELKSVSEYHAR